LSYCSSNLKRGRVYLSYDRGDSVYPKQLNKFIEILSEKGNFEMNGGKIGFATVGSLIVVVGNSTFVAFALVGSCCLMLGFPEG